MTQKKYTLAIDTSGKLGSLSLGLISDHKFETIDTTQWSDNNKHSEIITVKAQDLFNRNNIKFNQLNSIVCSLGPGSFTGVRVGLNFCKTLAYSLDLMMLGIDSFSMYFHYHFFDKITNQPTLVMLNAFRNLIYTSLYDVNGIQIIEPQSLSFEELYKVPLSKANVIGDAFVKYKDYFEKSFLEKMTLVEESKFSNLSESLLSLASQNLTQFKPYHQWVPLYLRGSEAEEKLKNGQLNPVNKLF